MRDFAVDIAVIFFFVFVIFGGIVGGALWFGSEVCQRNAEGLGIDYDFHIVGGCYVEWNSHMVPWDSILLTDEREAK